MCGIISNAKYLFISQVSISYFRRLINIFTHKFNKDNKMYPSSTVENSRSNSRYYFTYRPPLLQSPDCPSKLIS